MFLELLLIASKAVVLLFGASSRVGEVGAFRVFLNQIWLKGGAARKRRMV
jgi:hypothetical protein